MKQNIYARVCIKYMLVLIIIIIIFTSSRELLCVGMSTEWTCGPADDRARRRGVYRSLREDRWTRTFTGTTHARNKRVAYAVGLGMIPQRLQHYAVQLYGWYITFTYGTFYTIIYCNVFVRVYYTCMHYGTMRTSHRYLKNQCSISTVWALLTAAF